MHEMKVYGKALSMVVFTLSTFVLASKFFVPTTLNVFIQGEFITLKQISNIYTLTDVIVIAVSSCILGINATYLLFLDHSPKSMQVPLAQSPKAEHGDNSISKVTTVAANVNDILKVLKGNEPKVMKILIECGELNQAELASRTDIPKSTLSRTLADLEKRGLVIRYENGMSKMVKLPITFKNK